MTDQRPANGGSRNSILGMQCEAQTTDMQVHGEDLQRRNAPENWIYGVAVSVCGRRSGVLLR